RVAPSGAGAEAVGSWPPAGAAGVPPELAFAAVRFDGAIQGAAGVTLEGPEGRVTAEAEVVSCEVLGWREGTCVRLRWSGVLRPRATYRLRVGEAVRDRGGAAIGPWEATFETGASEAFGLRTSPLECALDEEALGPGCLLADDDAARLRLRVDGPVRAFLVGEHASDRVVAPRGEVSLRLSGLGPDALERAELRLVGLAGETHVEALELRTHPPLAPLTIAEVRADARGPEPRQEYVELLNSGAVPVSLEGLALADRPDRLGDVVMGVWTLPPGGRALLVADGFDPSHPDDPPVPDGVPLVRIGSSLASGGLSNAGEALYLRDAEGRRLSTVPAIPAPGPGVCVVREGAGRSADPIAFGAAPCTPGAP
ncbi:MAG: hypothetical protein CMH59_22150, partial [Myxococcales bacterium]|nr:hypothetical protein [Myxococcales bacterium]